jgi:hypothetical protein
LVAGESCLFGRLFLCQTLDRSCRDSLPLAVKDGSCSLPSLAGRSRPSKCVIVCSLNMSQAKLWYLCVMTPCLLASACSRQQSSTGGAEKTVGGPAPVAVSITPASGAGMHSSFTFVTSDPRGAAQLYRTHIQFRSSANPSVLCYVEYLPPNKLYLMNDALNAWLEPITPGTAATLQNSYCSVIGSSSSVQENGNSRAVKLEMAFKPPMLGDNSISLTADDRQGSASQPITGSWRAQ